jgi:ketosteroid isomerase-like protein
MKKIMPLMLSMVLFVSFSVNAFGQNADVETIKKLNRSFLNALINKDSTALSNILADDFLLINPSGIKRNKTDNLATLRLPNQQIVAIDIDSADVRLLTNDVGQITVWTNNTVVADGKKTILKICYQDTYAKRNKQWKAVAAHVTLLSSD